MQNSDQPDRPSDPPGVQDFAWGKEKSGIQLGIRVASSGGKSGNQVNLRAAVRNLSGNRVELEGRFGLAIQGHQDVFEDFGGPRASAPISLPPGDFLEMLGWQLGDQTELKAGTYNCWTIYRPKTGDEIRSPKIRVKVT